ncbi:hypothetical protein [Parahaliea aestuarii]
MNRILAYLWVTAAAVLFVYAVFVVSHLGNPHLMPDEWRFIDSFLDDGLLHNLLLPRNGHLHTVPYLFHYANWMAIQHSQWPMVWMGFALTLIFLGVFGWALYKDDTLDANTRVTVFAIASFYFYWMGNGFTLLIGNESVHAYLVVGSLFVAAISLYSLNQQNRSRRISAASLVIASLIAATSFGSGLVVLPAVLLLALITRSPPRIVAQITALLVLISSTYLWLKGSNGGKIELTILTSPDYYRNVLLWIGSPLIAAWRIREVQGNFQDIQVEWYNDTASTLAASLAAAISVLIVMLTGIQVWRRKLFLGLIGHILLTGCIAMCGVALLITLLRWPVHMTHPQDILSFRYYVWSSLFWFCLIGLITVLTRQYSHSLRTLAQIVLLGFLAFLCWGNSAWPANAWESLRQKHDQDAQFIFLGISPNSMPYHVLRFFLGYQQGEMVALADKMQRSGVPVLLRKAEYLPNSASNCAAIAVDSLQVRNTGRNLIDGSRYAVISMQSGVSGDFDIVNSQGQITGLIQPLAKHRALLQLLAGSENKPTAMGVIASVSLNEAYSIIPHGSSGPVCPLPALELPGKSSGDSSS